MHLLHDQSLLLEDIAVDDDGASLALPFLPCLDSGGDASGRSFISVGCSLVVDCSFIPPSNEEEQVASNLSPSSFSAGQFPSFCRPAKLLLCFLVVLAILLFSLDSSFPNS